MYKKLNHSDRYPVTCVIDTACTMASEIGAISVIWSVKGIWLNREQSQISLSRFNNKNMPLIFFCYARVRQNRNLNCKSKNKFKKRSLWGKYVFYSTLNDFNVLIIINIYEIFNVKAHQIICYIGKSKMADLRQIFCPYSWTILSPLFDLILYIHDPQFQYTFV